MKSKNEVWIKRIQDYRSSGLTAAKWCEKNGFSIHTLRYHITKINKAKKQQESNQVKWASVVPGQTESEINVTDDSSLKVTLVIQQLRCQKGLTQLHLKP